MVNRDLALRVWDLVARQARGAPLSVAHVCAAAVPVVGVDGAGLTIMDGRTVREKVHATDRIADEIEDWQLTLAQGPCLDAFLGSGPVLVAELDDASCQARWPAFTPAGLRSGAAALFALPLQVGAIQLGAMTLYRASPGPLRPVDLAHALVFADTAALIVLNNGVDAATSEASALHEAEIHQATGMLVAQLGVDASTAFARLRAYAYAHDRRLAEVARDVVAHRLRLEADPPHGAEGPSTEGPRAEGPRAEGPSAE